MLKKSEKKSNIIVELLNTKILFRYLETTVSRLKYECLALRNSIMLPGKRYSDVDSFYWLIGQTINSIKETSNGAQIHTNQSIINMEIISDPCPECDKGYCKLTNLKNIVYPGHEIIDIDHINTKTDETNGYYRNEIFVIYNDNKSKSFTYDCYFHKFDCEDSDADKFISIKY